MPTRSPLLNQLVRVLCSIFQFQHVCHLCDCRSRKVILNATARNSHATQCQNASAPLAECTKLTDRQHSICSDFFISFVFRNFAPQTTITCDPLCVCLCVCVRKTAIKIWNDSVLAYKRWLCGSLKNRAHIKCLIPAHSRIATASFRINS